MVSLASGKLGNSLRTTDKRRSGLQRASDAPDWVLLPTPKHSHLLGYRNSCVLASPISGFFQSRFRAPLFLAASVRVSKLRLGCKRHLLLVIFSHNPTPMPQTSALATRRSRPAFCPGLPLFIWTPDRFNTGSRFYPIEPKHRRDLLSGGARDRACPALVLADEPTVNPNESRVIEYGSNGMKSSVFRRTESGSKNKKVA
jgi:hypothetical protein